MVLHSSLNMVSPVRNMATTHLESISKATTSSLPTKVATKDLHRVTMAPTTSLTSSILTTAHRLQKTTIKALLSLHMLHSTISISMVDLRHHTTTSASNMEVLSQGMLNLNTIRAILRHLSNGISTTIRRTCLPMERRRQVSILQVLQVQAKPRKTAALWVPWPEELLEHTEVTK